MSCQLVATGVRESQSDRLSTEHRDGAAAACVAADRRCTFAQERTEVLEQAYPGNAYLRVAMGAHLVGPLRVDALQDAAKRALARHQVLRHGIGQSPQGFSADSAVILESRREMPDNVSLADALSRWVADTARAPLYFERAPLLRLHLLRLADHEHLLLVCAHRHVCDEESLALVLGEIAKGLAGRSPDGPPLPAFADFVAWQRQESQQLICLQHYQARLAGAAALLDLPTDHARPAIQRYRGASVPLDLPTPDRLRAFAEAHALDLPSVLLAAFAALLQRHSGQSDLVIGIRSSYRTQTRFSEVVGPLENTLALRLDLDDDPDTDTLLQRTSAALADTQAHSELPFERLIDALTPDRSLAHAPICQVIFDYRVALPASLAAGPLQLQPFPVDLGSCGHDLVLRVDDHGDRLGARLIYNPDLFEEATAQRTASHYLTLLADLTTNVCKRASALRLLSEPEWRKLVEEFNHTDADYPVHSSLARLFEAQVDRSPDSPALFGSGPAMSYGELDLRSSQLANHLSALGVGHETLVGVSMERSPELFVAVLAILKCGGCYVPVDPEYPRQRVTAMLEDTAVGLLLTKARWLDVLPPHSASILCLDRDWPTIEQQPASRPRSPAVAASLCYVVFTSGSTGRPKGVLVEQRQLLNRFAWMWREYPFATGDVSACKTALNFVDSLWELLGPLLQGVPSVLVPQPLLVDPQALVSLLAECRVSRMMLVPSLMRTLLDAHDNLAARLPLLREWCIGGEPLTAELARRFARAMPGRLLLNLYGLSEAFDACFFDAGQLADTDTLVPIGRPLANVQAYVLDKHRQPVPVGVIGELYVGGAGLARGYLGSPELSAEKFRPNPFRQETGARIYGTGDLARLRANGLIDYLGRSDHQVKIRGFRIEPDEVASALRSHPGVSQAVIVARPDANGELALAAYFLARDASPPAAGALYAWLRERLPEYMVPASYTALAALPLTPSGKVDRLSLPAPDVRPVRETPFQAPADATERAIADVWQAVLRVDRVGCDDNFFELGGSSLRMLEVNRRLCAQLQRAIPVLQMYQHPTVRSLARALAGDSSLPATAITAQTGRERATQRRELLARRQTPRR